MPTAHGLQTAGVLPLAGVVCSVPAAHWPSGMHAASFVPDEKVPGSQVAHVRSAVVEPDWLTCVPTSHVFQWMHAVAFVVAE